MVLGKPQNDRALRTLVGRRGLHRPGGSTKQPGDQPGCEYAGDLQAGAVVHRHNALAVFAQAPNGGSVRKIHSDAAMDAAKSVAESFGDGPQGGTHNHRVGVPVNAHVVALCLDPFDRFYRDEPANSAVQDRQAADGWLGPSRTITRYQTLSSVFSEARLG